VIRRRAPGRRPGLRAAAAVALACSWAAGATASGAAETAATGAANATETAATGTADATEIAATGTADATKTVATDAADATEIAASAAGEGPPSAARGEAVLRAAGGCTCHTNHPGEGDAAPELAGGRPLETPFGTFYGTNITPHRETGIGGWSADDFVRAMTEGLAPDGSHYFPVFPYPSFASMTRRDLLDLWAHLQSRPAVERENRPPDALPPFRWRISVAGWKALHFDPEAFEPAPSKSEAWNRGAYLVTGPGHCGECHTPRTLTGGLDTSLRLAGSTDGPEGELAPNITPDPRTGIGEWSAVDLAWYLETGIKPDGDDTQGLMAEVIEHGYAHLPQSDLRAIAEYLLSLPPIANEVKAPEGDEAAARSDAGDEAAAGPDAGDEAAARSDEGDARGGLPELPEGA